MPVQGVQFHFDSSGHTCASAYLTSLLSCAHMHTNFTRYIARCRGGGNVFKAFWSWRILSYRWNVNVFNVSWKCSVNVKNTLMIFLSAIQQEQKPLQLWVANNNSCKCSGQATTRSWSTQNIGRLWALNCLHSSCLLLYSVLLQLPNTFRYSI